MGLVYNAINATIQIVFDIIYGDNNTNFFFHFNKKFNLNLKCQDLKYIYVCDTNSIIFIGKTITSNDLKLIFFRLRVLIMVVFNLFLKFLFRSIGVFLLSI